MSVFSKENPYAARQATIADVGCKWYNRKNTHMSLSPGPVTN